jgi:hypothetical protein
MRTTLLTFILLCSSLVFSQTDSSETDAINDFFSLGFAVGNYKGDKLLNDQAIAGFVFNPYIEVGNRFRFHTGLLNITLDSTSVDTNQIANNALFEVGLSMQEQFEDNPFYIKASYLALMNSRIDGHRISAQIGLRKSKNPAFYLEYSRLFTRSSALNGNVYTFGINLLL